MRQCSRTRHNPLSLRWLRTWSDKVSYVAPSGSGPARLRISPPISAGAPFTELMETVAASLVRASFMARASAISLVLVAVPWAFM